MTTAFILILMKKLSVRFVTSWDRAQIGCHGIRCLSVAIFMLTWPHKQRRKELLPSGTLTHPFSCRDGSSSGGFLPSLAPTHCHSERVDLWRTVSDFGFSNAQGYPFASERLPLCLFFPTHGVFNSLQCRPPSLRFIEHIAGFPWHQANGFFHWILDDCILHFWSTSSKTDNK